MMSDNSSRSVLLDGSVPLGGVYANLVNVWHSNLEFTLEFAVTLPSRPEMPDAVYVAWMKLPPQVAWDLAQHLSDHVAQYEEEFAAFTPRPPDQEEP
ncbi:MAG: DUF3467 domain-containing protein [Gammaproteobacteria bacterium]|nr:DUF3467 domain-containing protein [Gammaproteobacteria bacterium]